MKIATKKTVIEVVGTLLLALLIFLSIRFSLESRQIDGTCMEPNLYTGQRVLVCKASYWFGDPKRGDIIVFRKPGEPKTVLIKRIIGMPGDRLEIRSGQVLIGDELLEEPYVKEHTTSNYSSIIIPIGAYFVMGDNRDYSSDSREWGTLPRENIIGRACLCYWPLSDWHLIAGHSYH